MHSDVDLTAGESTPQAPQEAEPAPIRYHIDLDWYRRVERSFSSMAEGRMCTSCRAKLGTEVETRVPVVDPKSSRVLFETRRVPYGANPITVIRDCCSKAKGYITAHMPLMEVAFRILLANGNQPMAVDDVAQQMNEHITFAGGSRSVSPEALRRMLDSDDYYGFSIVRVP